MPITHSRLVLTSGLAALALAAAAPVLAQTQTLEPVMSQTLARLATPKARA